MLTNEQLTTNLKVAKQGLTYHKKTAKRLGVCLVTYRKYEEKPYKTPIVKLHKLANILGVTLKALLTEKL